MADNPLSVKAASVGYGAQVALREVHLELGPGEIIGLIGPNGAGKSTLLKSALGALPLLGGRLLLGGADVGRMPPREVAKRCAYIAQEESLAFDFTAWDLVMMGRMPHHSGLVETKADIQEVEAAMRRAECERFGQRPVNQLSGGERQRVLLARAVAQGAPLLLLDEPSSHLDPGHSLSMERLLLELAEEGKAILVAAHDLNMALRLGGRCALAHDGKVGKVSHLRQLVESGQLDEAYGAPLVWHDTTAGPVIGLSASDRRAQA